MADVKKEASCSESFKKFNLLPLPPNSYSHRSCALENMFIFRKFQTSQYKEKK